VWVASGGSSSQPPARARVYSAYDACLLTGAGGIADPAAAPLWAGMQDASQATRAKVSYLAVSGPATAANTQPYLGALLVRHCNVIVTDGPAEQAAATADASRFPGVHFVIVGNAVAAANVTVLGGARSALRAAVAGLITKDANAAGD
jgi:basic membrane lipoprotein Med (substrate-binding protein (PBP1-ABC) superfamily)